MTIANDNVVKFTSRTEANTFDDHVNRIIEAAITNAVAHYRAGDVGRGEFVLQRLGMRLQRLEQVRS